MATLNAIDTSLRADGDVVKLRHQYAEALRRYCVDGAESALSRGYELGRLALERGMSLLDIVMLHEDAAADMRGDAFPEPPASRAAAEFLAETLVPFEMSLRGFFEANRALRDLNEKLESEARRIATMLHDGAGQMLFALQLGLGDLGRELPATSLGRISELLRLTGRLDDQLRGLSRELHPVVLDDLGLVPALELMVTRLARHTGARITIKDHAAGRLPAIVERCLYRVVQEALSNAAKHACASAISVRFRRTADRIACVCRDNGIGISEEVLAKGNGGLGMITMRERVESLRGRLTVRSRRGRGTALLITIPLDGL